MIYSQSLICSAPWEICSPYQDGRAQISVMMINFDRLPALNVLRPALFIKAKPAVAMSFIWKEIYNKAISAKIKANADFVQRLCLCACVREFLPIMGS